ncbi:MAG: response regulator, partial [Marinirhabdus sp.]
MKHSVVIVDDHNLLSQAIAGLVSGFDNFEVLYTCKNGQELLEKLKNPKNTPNIVLMDVNMPIMNGMETTAHLSENHPKIKVLALSIEEEETTIVGMLRAGAKGYLMKDVKKNELEKALQELMDHGFYHTNTVSRVLVNSLHGK